MQVKNLLELVGKDLWQTLGQPGQLRKWRYDHFFCREGQEPRHIMFHQQITEISNKPEQKISVEEKYLSP